MKRTTAAPRFQLRTRAGLAALLVALAMVGGTASASADVQLTYAGQGGPSCAELNFSNPNADASDFINSPFRLINPEIDVTGGPNDGVTYGADIFDPNSAASYQPDGTFMAGGFARFKPDGTQQFVLANSGYYGFTSTSVTLKLQSAATGSYIASATVPICNPDQDGDLYTDVANPQYSGVADNCPTVYNHAQTDTDGNGVGDACQTAAPSDSTAPTLTVSHTADGQNGWNTTSPVTETVTASDETGGSGLNGAPTCTVDGSGVTLSGSAGSWTFPVSGDGSHAVSCSASDKASNSNTKTDTVTIDTANPQVSITSPAANTSYLLGQSVLANFGCTDAGGSGLASCVGDAPNGSAVDTSAVGPHTFAVTATDNAGNSHQGSSEYTVNYGWSTFQAPINSAPTLNTGKAGRTYPVKWQLRDAGGNYISALSAVSTITYKKVNCNDLTTATSDALETTATGGTSLRYDSTANQYIYNWASPATAGCYLLSLTLDSGQVKSADFKLS